MTNTADSGYIPANSGSISADWNFRGTMEVCEEKTETEADRKRTKNLIPMTIYQCSLCAHQTPLRYKLKRHLESCFNTSKEKREKPRNVITSGAKFKCEYCLIILNKLEDLVKHKESHKTLIDLGLTKCRYCGFKFFSPDEYKVHLNENLNKCREKAGQPDNVEVSSELLLTDKQNEAIKVKHARNEGRPTEDVPRNGNHISASDGFYRQRKINGLYSCPCKKFQTKYRSNYLLHIKKQHNVQDKVQIEAQLPKENLLVCSKCPYNTDSQLQLTLHIAVDHTSSGSTFICPKFGCRFNTEQEEQLKIHLIDVHGLQTNNARNVENEPFISCEICNHQSQTDLQMKIHKLFQHRTKGQATFACPISECSYNSIYKHHLKKHLERIHNIGEEHLEHYGDPNKWQMDEDISEHALEGLREGGHKDHTNKEYKWRKSRKRRYDCKYCNFSSGYEISVTRHLERNHAKKQCGLCQKTIRGKFQMFWHKYVSHRDTSGVRQWLVICTLCGYEGLAKAGYHHGKIHKLPKVTFNAIRQNLSAGTITFKYVENVNGDSDDQTVLIKKTKALGPKEQLDVEDCISPGVKVLDWRMSDKSAEATPLTESENEEIITIQIKEESDDEERGNKKDGNIICYPNEADDLLVMKSEYIMCKQCPYEAKDLKSVNIHNQLVHITSPNEFQCSIEHCPYRSKYKAHYKRHLQNKHKIKMEQFYRRHDSSDSVSDMSEINTKDQEPCEEDKIDSPVAKTDFSGKAVTPFSRANNSVSFCKEKYICPKPRCKFCTDKRAKLKEHFVSYHKIKKEEIKGINRIITSAKFFACSECAFQDKKSDEIKVHFNTCHAEKAKSLNHPNEVFFLRSKLKQLPNYQLKCIICPYESQSKKDAYSHGWHHYHENLVPVVTFNKFIKNYPRGYLKFRYSTKFERRCDKCRFVGTTETDLYKHKFRHHKSSMKPTDRRQAMEMIQKEMALTRKQTREKINQKREDIIRKQTQRQQSRKLNNIKESAISVTTLQEKEVKIRSLKAEKSSQDIERLVNQVDTETEEKCTTFMNDMSEDNPDRHEKQKESFSLEEFRQIEITSESPSKAEGNSKFAAMDSDRIAAYGEEVHKDDEMETGEENEIIRIEFIGDSDAEDYGSEVTACAEEAPLETGMLRIKCKNEGCVYSCRDLKDAQNHGKSCKKTVENSDRCVLCRAVFNCKESLQNHIITDHMTPDHDSVTGQHSLLKPKEKVGKKLENEISYKCWMCGVVLSYRKSLIYHTHAHAREDNNFNLKVTFSQYKGDTIVDTVLINADPKCKPIDLNNVQLHRISRERCSRPPVLDYDPMWTIYSCTECNFKTNLEATLTKHEKLHWTAEKEKAFNERKWFTCGVCYYLCFDAASFKEHGEKHNAGTSIEETGEDSLLF